MSPLIKLAERVNDLFNNTARLWNMQGATRGRKSLVTRALIGEPRVHTLHAREPSAANTRSPMNRAVRTTHDPRCGQYRAFLE